ncbi:MAG TPA: FkbM family methyltransferase [Chloroflexota bacterium]|nr:FkbM family methyltransferase [Chloroflexota bacterium]
MSGQVKAGQTPLDSVLFRHPRLRRLVSQLVPDRTVTISLLHRQLTISSRLEIGLLRLGWLINSSPTGNELAALVSLAGVMQPGCTFVDVGANVGLYSVALASIGDAMDFDVLAIEPNPATAARLRTNLAPYRCATVLEAAVSNRQGRLPMVYSSHSSVTFRVAQPSLDARVGLLDGQEYSIDAVRLDQVPQLAERPIVAKIDVEGHEAEALDGMQGLFDRGQLQALMIDGFQDTHIPERLRALGYALYDARSMRAYDASRHPALLAKLTAASCSHTEGELTNLGLHAT